MSSGKLKQKTHNGTCYYHSVPVTISKENKEKTILKVSPPGLFTIYESTSVQHLSHQDSLGREWFTHQEEIMNSPKPEVCFQHYSNVGSVWVMKHVETLGFSLIIHIYLSIHSAFTDPAQMTASQKWSQIVGIAPWWLAAVWVIWDMDQTNKNIKEHVKYRPRLHFNKSTWAWRGTVVK